MLLLLLGDVEEVPMCDVVGVVVEVPMNIVVDLGVTVLIAKAINTRIILRNSISMLAAQSKRQHEITNTQITRHTETQDTYHNKDLNQKTSSDSSSRDHHHHRHHNLR